MWTPATPARDFQNVTWKIGIGAPGAGQWRWCAKGTIDDVRIYDRAVGAAEVELFYKAALGRRLSKTRPPSGQGRPEILEGALGLAHRFIRPINNGEIPFVLRPFLWLRLITLAGARSWQ